MWFSRYSMMAFCNSVTLLKTPRRMRFRVISAKNRSLDHVEPGRRGWCEVQVKAGMRFEPALYGRGLTSGIVVNDPVKVEIGRGLLVDQLEKTKKSSVPMARH